MLKIVKYVIKDILRSKIVLAYVGLLLAASFGLFNLGGGISRRPWWDCSVWC
jgi:Cu-processing system permease protein